MSRIFFIAYVISLSLMACNDGLNIEEPVINNDPQVKRDTTYYISIVLVSEGTIDNGSLIEYNDSEKIKRQEPIIEGTWEKKFSAKPGFAFLVDIKGTVEKGSVKMNIDVTDSLKYNFSRKTQTTAQGKNNPKKFDYKVEMILK